MRYYKVISYFITKTYAVGTLKNRLNESVILSTKIILMKTKLFTTLRSMLCFVYLGICIMPMTIQSKWLGSNPVC